MKSSGNILAVALLASISGAAAAADLTVGAFGGQWEKSLRQCVIEPFQKATGKTVDVVLGAPVQWVNQIAASPNKPPLDVIYMPSDNAFDVVDRGLAQKLTPDTVPNIAHLQPQFADIGGGYGVAHNYGGMGFIYNKQTVKEPPKSMADFIKGTLEKKWVASLASINYPGTLSFGLWNVARLNGGGLDNVEPGLKLYKQMKDAGAEFYTDPNQVLNALKTGEIDIAQYWDGRAWAFIDEGNPQYGYVVPSDGAVTGITWIQVVKNASPLALQFANVSLSKESQGCFASSIRYGVANKDARFDPKVEHEITRFDQIVIPPFKEIGKRQNQWIDAWNKQIGR